MDRPTAALFLRNFLDALEQFDAAAVGAVLADDVVHVEHPNALLARGLTRDKATMLASLASGRQTLQSQRYQLRSVVVDGDTIAFEAEWTGTLAIALKDKQPGDAMTAAFAVFLHLEHGKVKRWNNYDCFQPF
jgi:ketosteroid isomerase-like protein